MVENATDQTPFLISCICYTLDGHFVFTTQELKFKEHNGVLFKMGCGNKFSMHVFSVFEKCPWNKQD